LSQKLSALSGSYLKPPALPGDNYLLNSLLMPSPVAKSFFPKITACRLPNRIISGNILEMGGISVGFSKKRLSCTRLQY
ncbi:MAG: hypothetical protein FWD31_14835, partial [Planctomycetaceae bacterium]|nr:hypothetical protein [Planctomycetaceae bacterium]